jgi:hypothetical protein
MGLRRYDSVTRTSVLIVVFRVATSIAVCRWLSKFRKYASLASSGLVTAYKTAWRHDPEYHSWHLQRRKNVIRHSGSWGQFFLVHIRRVAAATAICCHSYRIRKDRVKQAWALGPTQQVPPPPGPHLCGIPVAAGVHVFQARWLLAAEWGEPTQWLTYLGWLRALRT